MILIMLGLIDIGVAIMLLLTVFGVPPGQIYWFFTLAHAVKGLVFIRNFLSVVDLMIVLYTLIAPFWNNDIITIFVVGFLLYKGAYSLA